MKIPIIDTDYRLLVSAAPGQDFEQEQWTDVKLLQVALIKPGAPEPTVDLRTDGQIHVTGIDKARLSTLLSEIDRAGSADRVITASEMKAASSR